jgi:rubrerythrin
MAELDIKCQHACKNTCATLNEALRRETAMVRFYESVLEECNIPEVSSYMNGLVDDKRKLILSLIQKLNEIHVSSQALDGIASSFNSTDG